MKKFFSLFAAMLFAGSMMAATVVFSGADFTGGVVNDGGQFSVTKGGVTLSSGKAYGNGEELRIYAGGSLTVNADVNITKITPEFAQNTKMTFEEVTPNATTWTIEATKQIRLSSLTVMLEGEGGEGGEQGDEIVLDVAYAEAVYITDAENGNWWQINLYKDWDGTNVTYPDLYIGVEPKSATAIAGTYSVEADELFMVSMDIDATTTVEATEAGDFVVTYMGNGVYRYQLSFVGDDGKSYILDKQLETEAYDGETDAEIILNEEGGAPASGDLATSGVHTLTPVAADATGTGSFNTVIDGIQLVWEGAYYANEQGTDFRVYAGKTMTITAGANISKVEIAGSTKKDQAVTVNHGTVTVGSSYAVETTRDDIENPLIKIENIGATSVTISCAKQLRAQIIRVTVDGEQGLEETIAAGKAAKVVRDGQLLILKGNKTFNAQGAIVK